MNLSRHEALKPIVIGRIPFLVCAPFFHSGLDQSASSQVIYIDGTPSLQNEWLRSGKVDMSPTSSLEYASRPDDYLLLPRLCTSGKLEIRSVRLFSQLPWDQLNGKRVQLSNDSATSNALFRILSIRRFGVKPIEVNLAVGTVVARVLIGDAALREVEIGEWPYAYDLAVEWKSWQDLPFAFGLWLVRKSVAEQRRQEVLKIAEFLRESVQSFADDPNAALAKWLKYYPSPLPLETIRDFYASADYHLTPNHLESLRRYFSLAYAEGFIQSIPELRFVA